MPHDVSQQARLAGTDAGKNGSHYKVLSEYKTRVLTDEDKSRVFFHETPVVSFNERTITLDTGGWWTRTTKVRMNQASQEFGLGFHVFQKAHDWFVDFHDKSYLFDTDTLTLNRNGSSAKGRE
jgi:hypothetical protein